MKLAHIIATRNTPTPQIWEIMCPVADIAPKIASLKWSWDTVFVFRVFTASERY